MPEESVGGTSSDLGSFGCGEIPIRARVPETTFGPVRVLATGIANRHVDHESAERRHTPPPTRDGHWLGSPGAGWNCAAVRLVGAVMRRFPEQQPSIVLDHICNAIIERQNLIRFILFAG